jgi:hypothetical protein
MRVYYTCRCLVQYRDWSLGLMEHMYGFAVVKYNQEQIDQVSTMISAERLYLR